ncbi:PREDICTED: odorant receptor 13a-like [Atta colombica]|uniref:odorant receptor 13a-like n=1 Tax=Atta colombica TaxID=520822 RepID=UPI00084C03C8|nr:PREDICTED: odorant receptor 13a-like [Atta colombica]
MSFFDNRYYYLNKRFLIIIGQWPFQSRLESNMMFAITSLFIYSLTVFEIWALAAGITDLSIIMENVSLLLVNSLVIIKLVNCIFTNDKLQMKELLEDIEETWKIKHTDSEKKILQHYAEKSRMFTIQYATAMYVLWLFYTTPPIIVSEIYTLLPTNETYTAKFLYRMDHVLDIDKYFNIMMLHGFISVFYIACVLTAIDTMFTFYTQHVCALFECLRFSDVFLSIYAISFLFQLGNVIISLSFGAAVLITIDLQLDAIIRILSSNLAQLIHIYFLCFISQGLIDHSSDFQNVIYSCDWYKISRRSKQLLKFTLLRTTKPCQIIAGKMFIMSMENFSSILKISLSYFTMLTSLQQVS